MERSRRILIINNLYPPQVLGGYERSIADFARILRHRGHQVLVLTTDNPEFATSHLSQRYPDPPVERCLALGGQWKRGEGSVWFADDVVQRLALQNLEVLNHHLQSFQPDVSLVGNLDFLSVDLVSQVLAAQVPVAHYVMNKAPGYPTELAPAHPLHRYVTCSDWVAEALRHQGYPAENARTIYPGAVVEEFYQESLPACDRLRIAYASIVMPYKGADVLAEALSLLHALGVDFTATFAGDTLAPEFIAELQRYIDAEGFSDRVEFVGPLSRQGLAELFQTHNVLAFPSRFQEPFGISQIEAMAAGLALVTSGTGGAAEIVNHGVDGLIFESENPLSLAESLAYLSTNPEVWAAIAQRGQAKALSQFNQHRAVEQLEALFEELLEFQQSDTYRATVTKKHAIGTYTLTLPANHKLDIYQATWHRYDTALGAIAQAVFAKYLRSWAIDIGANVGDTAALIRTYSEAPILCIEGNPEFLPYLEKNVAQLGQVQIVPCFVGPTEGAISPSQIQSQWGTASIVGTTPGAIANAIPLRPLEEILQDYPQCQSYKLLKTDTDGYDFAILQASLPALQTQQPVLFFEYDLYASPDGMQASIATIDALIQIGYSYFIIYDNFGNYLLSLTNQERDHFRDLNAYLRSNRAKSGRIVVHYFDICAFSTADKDLFEQLRQQELDG